MMQWWEPPKAFYIWSAGQNPFRFYIKPFLLQVYNHIVGLQHYVLLNGKRILFPYHVSVFWPKFICHISKPVKSLKTEKAPTTQSLAQVTVSELTRHSQGIIFLLYTQEMAKWVEYAGYVCLMNDFKGESTWLLGGTSIMRSTVLYLVTHVPYPRTKPLPVCHVNTNGWERASL